MIAFENWLSPTRQEHECRQMVIALIRKAIVSQWRDAEVHSFGSQDTELYLPQGDIDLVVVSDAMEFQRREGVLRAMAACLRRNNLATDVQVIAKAKVPIIKFVCTHGRYRCDISVNQTNGLKAADYVNRMQYELPAIRPLIMLTKHLLQQRGMSEVYTGGLGSFSVILLVVNFMQVSQLCNSPSSHYLGAEQQLPPLSILQLHPKVQRGEIDPTRNLGVLFLDFLELYGKNFGYDDTGVSVIGSGGYFHKARRGWKDHTKPWKLSVEDPQNPENDISTGSYNIISVRSALSGAFDMLTSTVCQRGIEIARGSSGGRSARPGGGHHRFDDDDDDAAARAALLAGPQSREKDPRSLLGSIIGVSRELLKARRDLLALYDSGVLQRLCGKPPPGREPSPGPSSSRNSKRSSRQPSPADPPSRARSPPPVSRQPNSDAGSGVKSIIDIKGAASTKANGQSNRGPQHSTPLRRQLADTSSSSSSASEEEDTDSRYVEHRSKPTPSSKGRRQNKAYVSEESESDDSAQSYTDASYLNDSDSYEPSDDESVELDDSDGGGGGRASRKTTQTTEGGRKQPRRGEDSKARQYWLDKAGVGSSSADDLDDYEYE